MGEKNWPRPKQGTIGTIEGKSPRNHQKTFALLKISPNIGIAMPWVLIGVTLFEVHLEEDLEKAPEAASEQRYARDAEEVRLRGSQFCRWTRDETMWGPEISWKFSRVEEISANHLGCTKPCKLWDTRSINWCRIFAINSTKKILTVDIETAQRAIFFVGSIGWTFLRLVNSPFVQGRPWKRRRGKRQWRKRPDLMEGVGSDILSYRIFFTFCLVQADILNKFFRTQSFFYFFNVGALKQRGFGLSLQATALAVAELVREDNEKMEPLSCVPVPPDTVVWTEINNFC